MKVQRYHGALSNDVAFILREFGPAPEEVARREQTLRQVQNALKKLCGNEFYVEDCSMRNYAADLHCAPVEFVIVDKMQDDRFAPTTDSSLLPDVYDASLVARALKCAGFEGGFLSCPPDTKSGASKRTGPPKSHECTTPWPTYHHVQKGGLLYPPQLRVVTPLQFTLTLPNPTILPMYHFLTTAGDALPNILREFIAIIYLWTRSLQMTEFTPTCLALIVIRFLQETFGAQKLDFFRDMKQMSKGKTPGCWVPHEFKSEHSSGQSWLVHQVWVDTSFTVDKAVQGPLAPLLLEFFSFWREAPRIALNLAVSVRQNKYLQRQHVEKQLTEPVTSSNHLVPDEPYSWRFNRLVVQDPFLTTYNHAEGVSDDSLRYLAYNCDLASRSIRRANPLTTIFGNNLEPLRINKMLKHSSDTGPAISELPEIPQAVLGLRAQTLRYVQDTICQNYGRHYKVELFGSTQYGASSHSSDLDLVIIDPERIYGFSPDVDTDNLPAIYSVKKLATILREAGFVRVKSVPSASVPIVKFRDPLTSLDCDINVNDQLGLFNTQMIKCYCDLCPLLRPMVKYIKRWAKPLGLNSPSKTGAPITFSSYALTLMAIGFLQAQGMLPNLQENLPELDENTRDGVFWIRSRAGRLRCDARYGRADGWKSRRTMDLGESLQEWFSYWGNVHQYKTHMMSVRKGGLLLRLSQGGGVDEDEGPETASVASEEQREEGDDAEEQDLKEDQAQIWAGHHLVVVDPFIRTKNVTGSISFQSVERFRLDCQRVVKMLEWGICLDDIICEFPPVNGRERRGPSRAKGKQKNVAIPPGQGQAHLSDKSAFEPPLPKNVKSNQGRVYEGSRKEERMPLPSGSNTGKRKGKKTPVQPLLAQPPTDQDSQRRRARRKGKGVVKEGTAE